MKNLPYFPELYQDLAGNPPFAAGFIQGIYHLAAPCFDHIHANRDLLVVPYCTFLTRDLLVGTQFQVIALPGDFKLEEP